MIKALRGYRTDEEVEDEAQNFMYASAKHKTQRSSAHSGAAIFDLIRARRVRILVISSVVLQMAQQLCGINAGKVAFSSLFI